MTLNLSTPDRRARAAGAGIVALLIFFGLIEGAAAWILGLIAIVVAVTAFTGFCPIYKAIGLSTLPRRRR